MEIGFRVFDLSRQTGAQVSEVYPHAGFQTLGGSRIPSKTTTAGLLARAQLLQQAGIIIEGLEMWSHDSLDACLAALIAQQVASNGAETVTCGQDGSQIWLPS